VYAGHFRYKIIPQQVKGKNKYAEIHHFLRLSMMNIECMPSEHSDSDEQDPAVLQVSFEFFVVYALKI